VRASDLHTDRQHLTAAAYGTSDNLAARQAIYRYLEPAADLHDWAMGQVVWNGDEWVLDAGCGNGGYLRWLAGQPGRRGPTIGLDLSPGMLSGVRHSWAGDIALPGLVVGDIQALPLPDASVDVVLAMHMLYHVPDVNRAIQEARRVLRPGGVFLAATNSDHDKDELWEILGAAVSAVAGGDRVLTSKPDFSFSLENGTPQLRRVFTHVARHDLARALLVPEATAVVRYVASMTSVREEVRARGIAWPDVLEQVERRVTTIIEREGVLHIATLAGVFVCS
jgi:SAM-dependent methyltransferase